HPNRTNGPGGAPKRPYDMAGWTLPYQMGVRADMIKDTFAADLEGVRLKADTTYAASGFGRTVETDSRTVETDRRTNLSVKTAMDALKRGARVNRNPTRYPSDAATP